MPVEIESDNRQIIQLSVAETVPPWELSALILDIRWLASQHQMAFSWTGCMNKKVAHWVATANSPPVSWVGVPPVPLRELLSSDVTSSAV
ncbi:unnamed protein product [Camellia sinensis]